VTAEATFIACIRESYSLQAKCNHSNEYTTGMIVWLFLIGSKGKLKDGVTATGLSKDRLTSICETFHERRFGKRISGLIAMRRDWERRNRDRTHDELRGAA